MFSGEGAPIALLSASERRTSKTATPTSKSGVPLLWISQKMIRPAQPSRLESSIRLYPRDLRDPRLMIFFSLKNSIETVEEGLADFASQTPKTSVNPNRPQKL
jgi:hypothetical protein